MQPFSHGARSIARLLSVAVCGALTVATVRLPVIAAAPPPGIVSFTNPVQVAQATHFKVGDRVEVNLSGTVWSPATVVEVTGNQGYQYVVRIDGENFTRTAWDSVIRRPQATAPNAAPQGAAPPVPGAANTANIAGTANKAYQWKVGDHVAVAYGPYFKPAVITAIVGGDYPYNVEFDNRNLMGGHTKASDIRPLNFANADITRTCPRADSPGTGGSTLATAFKSAIRNGYTAQAEDPHHVVVAFQQIAIAPIGTATAQSNYYVGQHAALGTTVYEVRTVHTVCVIPAVGGNVDEYEGRFECYRDRFNQWACGPASGNRRVRSTPLKR